ncbi:cytidylate kinase-like family protein [Caproiciproducens faecalis]|uniref:Cytidylate kinase-like family protein n=1 Tax=Caproiciproducens faecalis TaxID=2820301 RepID=A0ABS7DKQ6_9FIRM|nr:cytidylate kinase-like family protein [Caproiciproducens faecalis]MBW7571884.1 cytidylate kinase-like family protein [Caproiciproducens faecalis]
MEKKYVITISHQLGCGGAYIGNKLSEKLSIPFIDRQILKRVADTLNLPEEDIEDREEKESSFWDVFFREGAISAEPISMVTPDFILSDTELYDLETQYIENIADEKSCIILGRGGNYILRNHPCHLRVFVCADMKERIQRVSGLYKVSESDARKVIEKNDRERQGYIKSYTGCDMLNLKYYDICINTSEIGLDNSVTIIQNALEHKSSTH